MATINFNKEFNFWDILVSVGIQPSEKEKYEYSEQDEIATLIVHNVTQKRLDVALANYDHQAYLDGLPKPQKSETELLKEQVQMQQELIDTLMFEILPTLLPEGEI